jgi:hypothetical protein
VQYKVDILEDFNVTKNISSWKELKKLINRVEKRKVQNLII